MHLKESVTGGFQKAKTMVTDVGKYWNQPKQGEYVSYKEFTRFVVGSIGSCMAGSAGGQLAFNATCLFVGAIYGLKMMDFVMLGFVGMVLTYLFQPINMIITDNLGRPPKKTMRLIHWANLAFTVVGIACFFVPQKYFEGFMPAFPQVLGTKFLVQMFFSYWNIGVMRKLSPKFGKYRCWVIANILPSSLTLILLTWFPYNTLDYHTKFWVMNLFFAIWGGFGNCYGQTPNLQNVISPNTEERAKIISIGQMLYSIGYSIFNLLFPILATLAGGMTNLNTYKWVVPAFAIISGPITLFLAFGVKERVIQEEDHKPQVSILKGSKEVFRNKYLWITNISAWLGSFSAGLINITNMLIIYSMRQDWFIGILGTILGTAWTPGMLLAPILIKKFGKRNLVLFGRYTKVISSLLTVLGVYMNSFVLIVVSTYISTMLDAVVSIANTAMNADIWDYQQYISGERLDGCMGIFQFISAPVTTFTALFVPFLYGLVGFTSDWNILYDDPIRTSVLLITTIVGAVANIVGVIPYHFYDLTEDKHKKIIEELKKRAHRTDTETDAEPAAEPVLETEATEA